MTKVQTSYDLARPLEEGDLEAVRRAHGIYGIIRVIPVQPAMDRLNVEFDASRLSSRDVESELVRAGLPVARVPV